MIKIFISYRRADSRKDAGRIYDRLVDAFGKENIFKDMDDIAPGDDFRGILREAVAKCDVQLVIIGKQWLNIKGTDGNRRLDNSGDWVRIEVESALQRDSCRVIPVLVDNASMPGADDLPLDLRELASKNATIVRDDPDFHNDVNRLIKFLRQKYKVKPQVNTAENRPSNDDTLDVYDLIPLYYAARKDRKWELARDYLTRMRKYDVSKNLFDINTQERYVWQEVEREEADRRYNIVRLRFEHDSKEQVWKALQAFWQDFPGYDPDNIARKVRPTPKPTQPKSGIHLRELSIESVRAIIEEPIQKTLPNPKYILSGSAEDVRKIIGDPFDWCAVPAGEFLYGEDKQKLTLPAFAMAKYPITYSQYQIFIDDNEGFDDQRWWEGLAKWQFNSGKQKWGIPNHPRENVNWYDAIAFCRWLSWRLGGGYDIDKITSWAVWLPTEFEWEKAARGPDGLLYPYGNEFDKNKCNTMESGIEKTTPVTQYPQGVSPYGVMDMSGNVWEWCLTDYENSQWDMVNESISSDNSRVLRGGSWNYNYDLARVVYRDWSNPFSRISHFGFRLCGLPS